MKLRLVMSLLLLFSLPIVSSAQEGVPNDERPDVAATPASSDSAADIDMDVPVAEVDIEAAGVRPDGVVSVAVAISANEHIGPAIISIVVGGSGTMDPLPNFRIVESGPDYFQTMRPRQRIELAVPELRGGERRTFDFAVTIMGSGDAYVAAGIASADPGRPFSESSVLFLTRAGNEVFSGENLLSTREQLLLRRLGIEPALGPTTPEIENRLENLRQGGAVTGSGTSTGDQPFIVAPNNDPSQTATVEARGTIQFTDVAGGRHPVRFVRVEVWDRDMSGGDDRLAIVETNQQGAFSVQVPNQDEDGTGQDLYAIARSVGPRVNVTTFEKILQDGVFGFHSHAIRSATVITNAPGTQPVDLSIVTSNDEANHPNAVAFEIHESIDQQARYVASLEGMIPAMVAVRYPRPGDSSAYGVSEGLRRIRLGLTDGHDWDNIMHEYGHHLQAIYAFGNNPNGSHTGGANHCAAHGKDKGLRLAWSESWPTFFGIQAQHALQLIDLGVPNVGDTRYSDTNPSDGGWSYDIESGTSGIPSEGQEHALQRVTWDMYDPVDDGADMGVALPAADLWRSAKASGAGTFASFWTAIATGISDVRLGALGAILASQRIGPQLSAPAADITYAGTAPTFTWQAMQGCTSSANMRYSVRFWDAATGATLLQTPVQTATSFTPSASQAATVFSGTQPRIGWSVIARDISAPISGDYFGQARHINIPQDE